MAISKQQRKYHLAMAGEYLVAAQLQRLCLSSSVTYGNAKSADIIALDPESEKALVIEVKTSSKGRWPIGSRVPAPSKKIWVFVSLGEDIDTHAEFFVLTQSQLHKTLAAEETAYRERYRIKHGYEYGDRPSVARLLYKQAQPFRSCWQTIVDAFGT
ncbi:hypothetical protein [Salinisphaera orenii]|uniref:hypothetical protein n=1 Tax=Salinisphaera orenii TaxID=856731 RepID=UPI001C82A366|nr:hypothetical protein [Salinisphaera halophila]